MDGIWQSKSKREEEREGEWGIEEQDGEDVKGLGKGWIEQDIWEGKMCVR